MARARTIVPAAVFCIVVASFAGAAQALREPSDGIDARQGLSGQIDGLVARCAACETLGRPVLAGGQGWNSSDQSCTAPTGGCHLSP
jgi:hypothetical protein